MLFAVAELLVKNVKYDKTAEILLVYSHVTFSFTAEYAIFECQLLLSTTTLLICLRYFVEKKLNSHVFFKMRLNSFVLTAYKNLNPTLHMCQ